MGHGAQLLTRGYPVPVLPMYLLLHPQWQLQMSQSITAGWKTTN